MSTALNFLDACEVFKDNRGDSKVTCQRKKEAVTLAKSVPCLDCGRVFPLCAMDFDHVHGKKEFHISHGWASRSMESVRAEMAKCDVVCANCHRVRTANRRRRKQ